MDIETAREKGIRELSRSMSQRLTIEISRLKWGENNTWKTMELLEEIREDAAYRGRISGESAERWPDENLQELYRETDTAMALAKRNRLEELIKTLIRVKELV